MRESQHLMRCQSTASWYSSKLTRLRPPSFHNHSLHVILQPCSIMASKCISKLAELWCPSESPYSLDYGLQSSHDSILPSADPQTRLTSASKCISKLVRLQPPKFSQSWSCKCISPKSLDHSIQLYLQTGSITASKFKQSWSSSASPHSLDHDLGVHL